jgi:hypothetical protein
VAAGSRGTVAGNARARERARRGDGGPALEITSRKPQPDEGADSSKDTDGHGDIFALAWQPDREIDRREWILVGQRLASFTRCSQWWIGDWIRYGSTTWGEKYADAIRITGQDAGTLRNWAYVASRFPLSLRSDKLSWSHHVLIAPFATVSERKAWLERAERDRLTVEDLRIELGAARRAAAQQEEGEEPAGAATDADPGAMCCPNCGYAIPSARVRRPPVALTAAALPSTA